jgi:hypothetical protein
MFFNPWLIVIPVENFLEAASFHYRVQIAMGLTTGFGLRSNRLRDRQIGDGFSVSVRNLHGIENSEDQKTAFGRRRNPSALFSAIVNWPLGQKIGAGEGNRIRRCFATDCENLHFPAIYDNGFFREVQKTACNCTLSGTTRH